MMRVAFALVVVVAGSVGCATAAEAREPSADARDDGGYDRGYDRGYDGGVAGVAVESAPAPGAFDFFGGGESTKEAAAAAPPPPSAPPLPPPDPSNPTTAEDPEKPVEAAKRLVIYTGSMSLMVPVADGAADAFVTKVNGIGGYLQTRQGTTVTVRVPAAQFFSVVDELRKTGTVLDEQVNAQDVTRRVFDVELRLQTAEESRKRLVAILQSATKVEDILRIENEIRRLTDEIEHMKGELRNLADQVAFSTLTVAFHANAPSPRPYPDRTRSRFAWINQIGVEQVLYGF